MVSYGSRTVVMNTTSEVLILVVVDDGLVLRLQNVRVFSNVVLILVVVDDGLVPDFAVKTIHARCGLNPCCSGRWSRTLLFLSFKVLKLSLNPCCSGRWSRTRRDLSHKTD